MNKSGESLSLPSPVLCLLGHEHNHLRQGCLIGHRGDLVECLPAFLNDLFYFEVSAKKDC